MVSLNRLNFLKAIQRLKLNINLTIKALKFSKLFILPYTTSLLTNQSDNIIS